MSQPFNVDPHQVNSAAAQWDALRHQFDSPAPDLSGNGPESQAARAAVARAYAATEGLKHGVGQTAQTARQGAGAYQQQESQSADKLKDSTGPMNDINGLITGIAGMATPFITEATSFAGQLLGTGSSLGTSLASLAKGGTGASSPGTGIGLPPADQTPSVGVPDHDAHTASEVAPTAASQPEHSIHPAGRTR